MPSVIESPNGTILHGESSGHGSKPPSPPVFEVVSLDIEALPEPLSFDAVLSESGALDEDASETDSEPVDAADEACELDEEEPVLDVPVAVLEFDAELVVDAELECEPELDVELLVEVDVELLVELDIPPAELVSPVEVSSVSVELESFPLEGAQAAAAQIASPHRAT